MTDPRGGAAGGHRFRPLALVGTTASGKSAVALEVARRLGDVELVSVDSMQVYRGMDIGTAKPSRAERAEVAHHVIDLVDPWDEFDVHSFQQAVRAALADIDRRGKRALLVGGTGLYLRAVIDDLDLPGRFPEVRAELDREPDTAAPARRLRRGSTPSPPGAWSRPTGAGCVRALEVTLGSGRPFSSFGPGLRGVPADRVRARRVVAARARWWRNGSPSATHDSSTPGSSTRSGASLDGPGLSAGRRPRPSATGSCWPISDGECTLDEAVERAVRRTRRFARRQRVWFRRDPRITWIDAGDDPLRGHLPAWSTASTEGGRE